MMANLVGVFVCTLMLSSMGQDITDFRLLSLVDKEDDRSTNLTPSGHQVKHRSENEWTHPHTHDDLVDGKNLDKIENEDWVKFGQSFDRNNQASKDLDGFQTRTNLASTADKTSAGAEHLLPPYLFYEELPQNVKRYSFTEILAYLLNKGTTATRFPKLPIRGNEKMKQVYLDRSRFSLFNPLRLNNIIGNIFGHTAQTSKRTFITSKSYQDKSPIHYQSNDNNFSDSQNQDQRYSDTLGSVSSFKDLDNREQVSVGKYNGVTSSDRSVENKNYKGKIQWDSSDRGSFIRNRAKANNKENGQLYFIDRLSSFGDDREEKRKFDSIGGVSSFGSFGRDHGEKRKFDSIGGVSSFGSFGRDHGEKRKFDSIGDVSSFGGFGRDHGEKRKFDSIGDVSSFGGFGRDHGEKRKFDSIGGVSSFGGFGRDREEKRKFDSIEVASSFGGFGRDREEKRKFDSIGGVSSFGGFGRDHGEKRKFDSIGGMSSFGGFGRDHGEKRKCDSIGGMSSFGGFGRDHGEKRKFDSIGGMSSFGGFGRDHGEKRKFDSIGGMSTFGGFGRDREEKKFDSIEGKIYLDGFDKRQDVVNIHTTSDTPLKYMFENREIPDMDSRFTNILPRVTYNELTTRPSEQSPVIDTFKALEKRTDALISQCIDSNEERDYSTEGQDCTKLVDAFRSYSKIGRNKDTNLKTQNNRSVQIATVNGKERRRFDRISNNLGKFLSFGKRTYQSEDITAGHP